MIQVDPGDALLPIPAAVEKALGYRPHPSTCCRWHRKGVNGVRLRAVRVGSSVRTTQAEVHRFVAAQNQARESLAAAG